MIKNPDFIFDIQKPTKIEGSLNVVGECDEGCALIFFDTGYKRQQQLNDNLQRKHSWMRAAHR